MRIVSCNLCEECIPHNLKNTLGIDKVIESMKKINPDIICFQEINYYDIEKIEELLEMEILSESNYYQSCVMINPRKIEKIENNVIKIKQTNKIIYINSIHLADSPSFCHYINNKKYSNIDPKDYSISQILDKCRENREKDIILEVEKEHNNSIIAGDFNEPSHLDLPGIDFPISKIMETKNFIDSFRYCNNYSIDYSWPIGKYYQKEPKTRIDYIYTKNLKIIKSYHLENDFSDHKIVISEMI